MPAKTPPEPVEEPDADSFVPIERTGGIDITIKGVTFHTRHPDFGELRDLLADAEAIDARQKSLDIIGENIEFWRSTIKMLSGEEPPPPESFPTWFGGPELPKEATIHWLKRPTRAPGS